MKALQESDEIDLIKFIQTVWDGKFRIIAIIIACVAGVFGFETLGPEPSFIATTEIKPILASDAEGYHQSNEMGFFAVYREVETGDSEQLSNEDRNSNRDRDSNKVRDSNKDRDKIPSAVLHQMFLEQLENRSLLAGIFEKQGLLERKQFDSDRDYKLALTQLAANVSTVPPVNEKYRLRGESREYWTLQFEFNDQDKWLAALAELRHTANENVQNAIKSRFYNLIASAKQKRAFDMEDLDAQISILITTYDSETESRLTHLAEQAMIARKLGISKQTSIPQASVFLNFNTQGATSLYNRPRKIENETLLYLRGYDALEKEMELIKERKEKRAFVDGLFLIEQKKLLLSADQTPERAERLFAKTPVMSSRGFQAASFDVGATKFQYKSKRTLMLALALVAGGVVGVFYVLISSELRSRREAEAE